METYGTCEHCGAFIDDAGYCDADCNASIEAREREFIATLQANSEAWALADFGAMDTVIQCQTCGHYEVCSDREAAIFVMTEAGCSACESAV